MLSTRYAHRAGYAIATFSMIAMTACKLEKDENGGRPTEVVATTTPVTVDTPTPATTLPPGTAEVPSGTAWEHYMLGLELRKSGDLVSAEAALKRTLELDPKHVKGHLNLGRVYLDQDKPRDARTHIVAALKLDSTSSDGYRLLGRVHAALKQNEEAIASYRLALARNPDDTWSMNNLALILIQQQRYTEALPPLARAVKLDSTVAVFQNNLGIALEHLGQYGLATSAFRSALSADSSYTKAVLSLARVEFRKEDPATVPVDLAVLADTFDREVRTSVGVAVVRKAPAPVR